MTEADARKQLTELRDMYHRVLEEHRVLVAQGMRRPDAGLEGSYANRLEALTMVLGLVWVFEMPSTSA